MLINNFFKNFLLKLENELTDDKMKIAQISATFPPYAGGTGNVCYNYSIELAKMGHEVTVFTSNNMDEKYNSPDLIKVNAFKPLFKIGNAPFIPELLRINNYDIIHLHYPFFFGAEMIYLISKFRQQKYFITYHNDVILEGFIGFFLMIYNKIMLKLILNNVSKLCVTSLDYANNSLIENIVKDNEKVIEIPNGVNLDKFILDTDINTLKTKYKLENKDIILFVGALDKAHYFKGVEYLLSSLKLVLDQKKVNPFLVIVGEGELKNHYYKLSQKLGIEANVRFVGKLDDKKLVEYYKLSDLVILPSINKGEAFGLVLVEAMALSKPVIASNLPGVRTVVDDGINGFLVEPQNANELSSKIQCMFKEKKILKKMGKNGRKKVEEKYSWKNIVKKLENQYKEVLK